MTPEQAISLLERATSQLKMTRPEHYQVQVAVETLENLVKSTAANKEAAKPQETTPLTEDKGTE